MYGPYQKLPQKDQQLSPVVDPYAKTQPIPTYKDVEEARRHPVIRPQSRARRGAGCLLLPILLLPFFIPVLAYFLAPLRTNILILGIDARPQEGFVGRTDTMILSTIIPLKPYVGALSIPRDLWVSVPGHGENRINTAHFFAEAEKPGSGPEAALDVIQKNFGVRVGYYIRIRFSGFKDIVDALNGVEVNLPQAMSGYTAGKHHLNGEQALALVRDRETSDDFYRMQRGQIFLKSLFRQALLPASWSRIPAALSALKGVIDTNIPAWQWPRLGLAILRAGPDGIDTRSINREMVSPFITSGGADVLGPVWGKINPVLMEMFGQ